MAGTEEDVSTELNTENTEEIVETGGDDGGAGGEIEEERGSGCKFPLARIKKIMKADPDLNLVNQDAVFLIAKATELFVESLILEAYQYTSQARKKTVTKRDIDNCISAIDTLAFLDGAMD